MFEASIIFDGVQYGFGQQECNDKFIAHEILQYDFETAIRATFRTYKILHEWFDLKSAVRAIF